ncbi:hypothetical protein CIK74_03790 [Glutamicibacter sp. BW77]|nr:hypothetical protein CIK74_03790 [Glutamicibacter sp. BW77]HBV09714.1 hypothetical protein [Micrococcaceae bacterium]
MIQVLITFDFATQRIWNSSLYAVEYSFGVEIMPIGITPKALHGGRLCTLPASQYMTTRPTRLMASDARE